MPYPQVVKAQYININIYNFKKILTGGFCFYEIEPKLISS